MILALKEASDFIDAVMAGKVDPARVQSLIDKGKAEKNSVAPGRKLGARANPTVCRHSGLFVPAKYAEAVHDRKDIWVGLWSGMSEISGDDYERQKLHGGSVSFVCGASDWGRIDGYSLFVGNIGQYFPLTQPKDVSVSDTITLKMKGSRNGTCAR